MSAPRQEGTAMEEGATAIEPRSMSAERGWVWWTDAWALFMRNAPMWVALGLILFVGLMVVGMVPVLGAVAILLAMPVLSGGWMLAARKVHDGGAPEVADLFAGFQSERIGPLLVLGALLLAAMVVIGLVAGLLGAGAVFGLAMGGGRHGMGGMMTGLGAGLATLAVAFVLGAVVTMAWWFAPALVALRGMPPVQALQASVSASLRNVPAFLVFGAVGVVASIVASIPFGLGWIVLLPLSMLAAYVSYRDVFEA
jgi:hypothetical protein